ncbi:MAG TPA: hypothetical protein VHB98_14430, partial [Chloroflexota bacterium]|nr:hypothetical protein [Chloroflexota bacterium]
LRAAISAPLTPADRGMHAPVLATIRAALGEEQFAQLWAEGQEMIVEQAVAEALMESPAAGSLAVS